MIYCVKIGTSILIEGSENPVENIIQNAIDRGFLESEIEMISEEEYLVRKDAEPKPIKTPTTEERIEALEAALLEVILNG